MTTTYDAEPVHRLRTAARSVRTTFDGLPRGPVHLDRLDQPDPAALGEALRRYERHGFAVLQLATGSAGPGTAERLAEVLGLGAPFVPPLYARSGNSSGLARISAATNAGTTEADHPSFGRTDGQRLHVDGTLQEIGLIATSLLVCEAPAAEGGETLLFNSLGAFTQLLSEDPAAAVALTVPGVLVRQANINGSTDAHSGPTFALRGTELVGRFSVSTTDRWEVPAGVDEADLWRAVGFLTCAALPGSSHHARLTLAADQVLLLANSRISHGRTSYRDSETARRCLYRSLHLRHPDVSRRPGTEPGR